MPKKQLGIDVLKAAKQRIETAFDLCERVYLSFSAGKDSTVMLHLVADEARKRNRKFGLMLIDLDGQYKCTIEFAEKCCKMYDDDCDPDWVSRPINIRNSASVDDTNWANR